VRVSVILAKGRRSDRSSLLLLEFRHTRAQASTSRGETG